MDPPPTIFARSALGVTGLASPPRAFLGASAILSSWRVGDSVAGGLASSGSGKRRLDQNGGQGRGVAMAPAKKLILYASSQRTRTLSPSVATGCGSRSCEA